MSTAPLAKLSEGCVSGTMPPEMAGDIHDNQAIGARLETIRRSMKVSQEVMAERLEPLLRDDQMTAPKWNNYAKGRDRIPVPIAIAVCILSGVDLDFIYRNDWGGLSPDVAGRLHRAMTEPKKRFRRP